MDDLLVALTAKVPLVVIETDDEKRACDQLLDCADGLNQACYQWTVSEGVKTLSKGMQLVAPGQHAEPEAVLRHIKDTNQPGVYVLCDFHPYLSDNPLLVRLLKDIALNHDVIGHILVLVSHELSVPPELRGQSLRVRLQLPSEREVSQIVREEARRWQELRGGKASSDRQALQQLVRTVRGLGHQDVRRLVRTAIFDDGVIDRSDIPAVNKAKFELMNMDGVLSFEFAVQPMDQVGGLDNLKSWLSQRQLVFANDQHSEDVPKGMLLVGVQGAGKSLAAKAVASLWQLPLLRLDFAALYNKFFGETERNLRQSLAQAELMSPCVLWIDEIEKGLATGDSDNGTSKRVLGTLLTWMAERKERVFMVATSNDISRLPPELMRKGRFDEIFFVDLPGPDARRTIFTIHLNRRKVSAIDFDLAMLVEASEGFSGAEIEQAVVSAVFAARAREIPLNDQLLLAQVHETSPLSVVMAEQVAALRGWAQGRTVMA